MMVLFLAYDAAWSVVKKKGKAVIHPKSGEANKVQEKEQL